LGGVFRVFVTCKCPNKGHQRYFIIDIEFSLSWVKDLTSLDQNIAACGSQVFEFTWVARRIQYGVESVVDC